MKKEIVNVKIWNI